MSYLFAACLMMGGATFLTRLAPFLVGKKLKESQMIAYIGAMLPASIMLLLVIHCLKDTTWDLAIPEAAAIAVLIPLHLWKRNSLLSILAGTAIFIALRLLL